MMDNLFVNKWESYVLRYFKFRTSLKGVAYKFKWGYAVSHGPILLFTPTTDLFYGYYNQIGIFTYLDHLDTVEKDLWKWTSYTKQL